GGGGRRRRRRRGDRGGWPLLRARGAGAEHLGEGAAGGPLRGRRGECEPRGGARGVRGRPPEGHVLQDGRGHPDGPRAVPVGPVARPRSGRHVRVRAEPREGARGVQPGRPALPRRRLRVAAVPLPPARRLLRRGACRRRRGSGADRPLAELLVRHARAFLANCSHDDVHLGHFLRHAFDVHVTDLPGALQEPRVERLLGVGRSGEVGSPALALQSTRASRTGGSCTHWRPWTPRGWCWCTRTPPRGPTSRAPGVGVVSALRGRPHGVCGPPG
ncbi:unnamed protein product, partial [Prorocentrum cordatum]